MELFLASNDLVSDKPWASGVAKSAFSRVSDALLPLAADYRLAVTVRFTRDAGAIPRLVVQKEPTSEWIDVSMFLPVSNWEDRHSARPLAASAIVSCLIEAGKRVGVNPDDVLQYAVNAGIEIDVAETILSDDSDPEPDLAAEFPDMAPLFTSPLDECGPLGNDTGADILELYRDWRADQRDNRGFLDTVLRQWGVGDPLTAEITETALSQHSFDIMTRDDAVIGLAFAQYFVDGFIQSAVRDQCLSAIDRQSLPIVIQHRGWTSPAERLDALAKMKAFIERAEE